MVSGTLWLHRSRTQKSIKIIRLIKLVTPYEALPLGGRLCGR